MIMGQSLTALFLMLALASDFNGECKGACATRGYSGGMYVGKNKITCRCYDDFYDSVDDFIHRRTSVRRFPDIHVGGKVADKKVYSDED